MNTNPLSFTEFTGQPRAKRILELLCKSAKNTGNTPSHLLLSGQPGLGKTTLARIMAKEMNGNLIELVAGNLKEPEQLNNILAGINHGDVLFIDEIHTLPRNVEELLYGAMEGQPITIVQQGYNELMKNIGMNKLKPVRVSLSLKPFTLIGATTLQGLVSAPLLSRFSQHLSLEPYTVDELSAIVMNASNKMSFSITIDIATEIARRSRATARTAIGHLRWVYEYCNAMNSQPDMDAITEAFALKEIDDQGLTKQDIKYLRILVDACGTVGLSTIAVQLGEDVRTIEHTIEPYLLREGYIRKTPKGRAPEQKAFDLLSDRKVMVA